MFRGEGERERLRQLLEGGDLAQAEEGPGARSVVEADCVDADRRDRIGVASRIVESTIIGVGVISLLSVLTLRDDLAASIGEDGTSLDIAGQSLVAVHDWTFLLGPGFCVGVNGLLLGYLMYRTGLMPPRLAALGLVGGPLIFASSIAVLFGAYEQDEGPHMVATIPEFGFEASFAIYLIVKGFRPSPVLGSVGLLAALGLRGARLMSAQASGFESHPIRGLPLGCLLSRV